MHDVENPVNEKPTTITSHVKNEVHHEKHRPDSPPFDESFEHSQKPPSKVCQFIMIYT